MERRAGKSYREWEHDGWWIGGQEWARSRLIGMLRACGWIGIGKAKGRVCMGECWRFVRLRVGRSECMMGGWAGRSGQGVVRCAGDKYV